MRKDTTAAVACCTVYAFAAECNIPSLRHEVCPWHVLPLQAIVRLQGMHFSAMSRLHIESCNPGAMQSLVAGMKRARDKLAVAAGLHALSLSRPCVIDAWHLEQTFQ